MISKRDVDYLRVAEMLSQCSDYPRIKIGAVLVNQHHIIAVGYNMLKSHPKQRRYNKSANIDFKNKHRIHAEVAVLRKANKQQTQGATLYICRRRRDNIYGMCKPCSACMQYIIDAKIKRVVYTIDGGIREMFP